MPETPAISDGAFVGQCRALIKDLFAPSAFIYWADLLISAAVGYTAFYFAHRADFPIAGRIALFILSCLAFYRLAMFTHELIHIRENFTGFRVGWNLLVGIPLLVPSFTYYTHLDHHRPKHYGTDHDGEYLPLGCRPFRAAVMFVINSIWIPGLTIIRFGLLTPLSWISPKFRDFVHARASSLVIDPMYVRPLPPARDRRIWRLQEAACLVYLAAAAAAVALGWMHWTWIADAYAMAAAVLAINAVRTLAAHRYGHCEELPGTLTEQFLDSINHPRNALLSEIWAPVGLRFHALHHLFPGLPYHALPKAHWRLVAGLPQDSMYRRVESPGLFASLAQLYRDTRSRTRAPQIGHHDNPPQVAGAAPTMSPSATAEADASLPGHIDATATANLPPDRGITLPSSAPASPQGAATSA